MSFPTLAPTLSDSGVPPGWICPDGFFNDGICDCQCGAPEDDCLGAGGLNPFDCPNGAICVDQVNCVGGNTFAPTSDFTFAPSEGFTFAPSDGFTFAPSDGFTFAPSDDNGIPAGWICPDGFFNDGICDCQCGAPEDDCLGAGGLNPFDCPDGAICVDQVNCVGGNTFAPTSDFTFAPTSDFTFAPSDGFTFAPSGNNGTGVPPGWICPDDFFNDDICDCLCGAPEDDCLGDGGLNPFDCGPGEICIDQQTCFFIGNGTFAPSFITDAPTNQPDVTDAPTEGNNNGGGGDDNNAEEDAIIISLLAIVVVLLVVLICVLCVCFCFMRKQTRQPPLEEVGYVGEMKAQTLI